MLWRLKNPSAAIFFVIPKKTEILKFLFAMALTSRFHEPMFVGQVSLHPWTFMFTSLAKEPMFMKAATFVFVELL